MPASARAGAGGAWEAPGRRRAALVLISGGAKVDDKLGVLQNLGGHADEVLIGGKMAEQIRESNPLDFEVQLPVDIVAVSEFAEDAETKIVPFDALPEGWLGLDIGPETRERFARASRAHADLLERADGRLRVAILRGGHQSCR